MSIEEILRKYPDLQLENIQASLSYASLFSQRNFLRMTNLLTDTQKQEIIEDILVKKNNQQNFLRLMKQRREKGMIIARKSADFLKQNYGVSKVILFGSLLDYRKMNFNSDIDLAVWNLSEKDYFKAVGFLLEIAEDFSIDLVEIQNAKPYILESISEGIELKISE